MDKVYIDDDKQAKAIELPAYGEVRLIVKEGKVVQYYTIESYLLTKKQPEK